MKKYIYQKFLLHCEYDHVDLDEYARYDGNLEYVPEYGEEYCLFDVGKPITRQISIQDLDNMIDTLQDWEKFISSLREIDTLVIKDTHVKYENPIVEDYRKATIMAYLKRLEDAKMTVVLYG